jgi:predicted dehydrogenase
MAEKESSPSLNTSRRDFIKSSTVAAAGFMIVPRYVLGGKGYTAPSDKLVIAGVGAGGKGQSDIANFYASGNAEIAYLCDVDTRSAAKTVAKFPKAKFYKDWREMLDKEHNHFDAVSVSIPDNNHAIVALSAMQLGKHVYVQKPMAHDIYEARALTNAAKKYNKVVTQMGNQGASNDGVRQMREWYDAGIIGDVHTVYCWTDRPVWPQGIEWPETTPPVPKELDWDLWQGTAPNKAYIDNLVPFNWRGWYDYGTGALGDMGCHIMEAAFRVLNLQYVKDVQSSVGTSYSGIFDKIYAPDSFPLSSHITLTYPKTEKTLGDVKVHWMDGGIQPERPEELGPNEEFGDNGNGMLFIGTKGKMMAGTYSLNAQLLPTSRTKEVKVPQTIARVPGGDEGHYAQWVNAAIAGKPDDVSSPFKLAGPLTEALLMANLSIRGHNIRKPIAGKDDEYTYPGENLKLIWDNEAMRVTNFDDVNQFIKREYRDGWKVLG